MSIRLKKAQSSLLFYLQVAVFTLGIIFVVATKRSIVQLSHTLKLKVIYNLLGSNL